MKDSETTQGGGRYPGVILAGGLSSRMGESKADLRLGGVPLLERAIRRLRPQVSSLSVSANEAIAALSTLDIPVFGDPGGVRSGPLGGILVGLLYARSHHPGATHIATVPTDSPFFPSDLVTRLAQAIDRPQRIVVATSSGGIHPVFALWPVGLADDLSEWMGVGGTLRLRAFLDRHDARTVAFPDHGTPAGPLDPFYNINTPDDLAMAENWLRTLEP